MSECITIHQYGDKYFVFHAQDVKLLRTQHRIVGAFSGTLTQYPLQNTFYGLPLLLLPEEVQLIQKHGWGQVISKKKPSLLLKDKEGLKTKIFDYFWTQGFYITSGIKFGGHYLLYDHDPMCTHSNYIVDIYNYKDEILPLDIIRMGRVGTSVKKTFVLTCIQSEEEKEKVTTFSIEWAGF